MSLGDLLRTNAAYREFTDEPVTDQVLHRILDTARFAPSGGNRQPWRVVVVKDPDERRFVREQYQIAWREYVAHLREGLIPFAPITHRRWITPAVDLDAAHATPAPNEFADHLEDTPCMLLLFVDLTALAVLDNGLDRQSIVGGGSIYPFGYNVLLAAREEGLGGVMTTALCRREPEVMARFGVPEQFGLAALIAIGYPVRVLTKLRRAEVAAFTTIDRFDGESFGG
ncbi:MAG: nitroreductase family protein [Acidimicrobiales bacterium]